MAAGHDSGVVNKSLSYTHEWWWWFSHQLMSNSGDSMDYSPSGIFVHGIFQARILKWVAISFSMKVTEQNLIYRFQFFHLCHYFFRYAPSKRWHIDTIMRVLTTVSSFFREVCTKCWMCRLMRQTKLLFLCSLCSSGGDRKFMGKEGRSCQAGGNAVKNTRAA